jgi:NADPH2:quinone reductase
VLDPVGGAPFDAARRLLAWEGRLLVVGFASGDIPSIPANHVLLRNYAVIGVHLDAYRRRAAEVFAETVLDVLNLCSSGAVRPVVGQVVDFDGVPKGWQALRERAVLGKLVVRIR